MKMCADWLCRVSPTLGSEVQFSLRDWFFVFCKFSIVALYIDVAYQPLRHNLLTVLSGSLVAWGVPLDCQRPELNPPVWLEIMFIKEVSSADGLQLLRVCSFWPVVKQLPFAGHYLASRNKPSSASVWLHFCIILEVMISGSSFGWFS